MEPISIRRMVEACMKQAIHSSSFTQTSHKCTQDHGAVELAVEPISIRRAVEACMDVVALEAQQKGLALAYSLDTQLARNHLIADPIRLRQVIHASTVPRPLTCTCDYGPQFVRVTVYKGSIR